MVPGRRERTDREEQLQRQIESDTAQGLVTSGMGIWQLDTPSIEDGVHFCVLGRFSKDRWLITHFCTVQRYSATMDCWEACEIRDHVRRANPGGAIRSGGVD